MRKPRSHRNNFNSIPELFFIGKYYEHYNIFLEIGQQERLNITHHTLPIFVPVEKLQLKYLNTNIRSFIHAVSDYLNCFVSRREQVFQVWHSNKLNFGWGVSNYIVLVGNVRASAFQTSTNELFLRPYSNGIRTQWQVKHLYISNVGLSYYIFLQEISNTTILW